ncbi:hypothetical protein LY90DRAFT_11623 [Neocallimastix californiae]|uniref:Serine protease n=1 Tax=Neocallimastix californiae TaxID=1754190 RepID=A0A1Y2CK46_9FUNG|nr:hypothetical protein LY90DRAFT_11623 [Neocallimastix californiae]|eukprot:ORY46715.1 hypothetical protein LY90DRAFT_11623 [Neocallimastix californiae]
MSFFSFVNNISRSMCLIEINKCNNNRNNFGIGIFIKIPIPSRELPLYGLMTNNHVLDEESLKPGTTIYISFRNNERYSILINEEDFIFTSELIDVTFIELNEEEMQEEIDPFFLQPSNEDTKKNKSILIFQYSYENISMAPGIITSSHNFNFHYYVSTNSGSSSAFLLNKNFNVVGVHKSRLPNKKENKKTGVNAAVKFSEIEFAIQVLYNNNFIYGNERARKSVRSLLESEIEILNEYGLEFVLSSKEKIKLKKKKISSHEIKIIEKSLFQCDLYGNSLLFYRTNYAWYITILSQDNNISNYSLENLKTLDWSPIIPNSNELDDSIISRINDREYILIAWLKLTELKYL